MPAFFPRFTIPKEVGKPHPRSRALNIDIRPSIDLNQPCATETGHYGYVESWLVDDIYNVRAVTGINLGMYYFSR